MATLGLWRTLTSGFARAGAADVAPAASAPAHAARVEPWVDPHLERAARGVAHPVEDFLFTYYSFRPAALRRWHPGFGVRLADARRRSALKGYADVGGPGARA